MSTRESRSSARVESAKPSSAKPSKSPAPSAIVSKSKNTPVPKSSSKKEVAEETFFDMTKGLGFGAKPVSKDKKSTHVPTKNVVESARSNRSKREPTPPPVPKVSKSKTMPKEKETPVVHSTKLSKSKTHKESPVKKQTVKDSKSKSSKVQEKESKSKKPVVESKAGKSSNPFGFGVFDEPIVDKKHEKKQEKIAPPKKTRTELILETLKPVFVKKRDIKAESKFAAPLPVPVKKEAKPEMKASKPMKFQKRDRSVGKPASFLKPAAAKPADKSTSKFLGLLSGENPFLKTKKTLIATPSKFEIRTEVEKPKGRGRPRKDPSDKSTAAKKPLGIRGKLDKVKKSTKSPDTKSKVPKMSAKSKKIEKEKIKKLIQKAKKEAKIKKISEKKASMKAKKAEKARKKDEKKA